MNKRNAILCAIAGSCMALVGVTFALASKPSLPVSSLNEFSLTVNSYNGVYSGTTTTKGNAIAFGKSGLSNEGGKPKLANNGAIYNTTKISGIQRVKVTLMSGSVNLFYSYNDATNWSAAYEGTDYDLSAILPNYFKVQATTANTVIDKIEVSYACVDYQGDSTAMAYSLYVNGQKSESIFVDATKPGEGYDKQFKAVLDVYPGDVLSFKYNNAAIYPDTSGSDSGNNAWHASRTRNLAIVTNYKQGAELYLKKTGNNYDIWLTGKGTGSPTAALDGASILQAWNWSVSNIISNLDYIADAGFTAIQVSPMQVRKDVYASDWGDQWWKLYQPHALRVATSASESIIGTKSQLTTLCAQAKAKGIGIIMDVVVDHLAGTDVTTFDSTVKTYEPEIYGTNDLTQYPYCYPKIHNNGYASDDSPWIYEGSMGNYPDLDTGDPHVMARALSLFKEYLDCGVTGFRIDAAKHIETPEDGDGGSEFFPYVINGSRRYAALKGYDVPYYYGEALNNPGNGRYFSWYLPYMDLAVGYRASDIRDAVNDPNGNDGKNLYKSTHSYDCGVGVGQMVLWGESHDDYKAGHTSGVIGESIDKVYAIQASLTGCTSLYVARPENSSTDMGSVGSTQYRSAAVAAANAFHNRHNGQSEAMWVNNGAYVNVRGSGSEASAMAINLNNSYATFDVTFPDTLGSGTYRNVATNRENINVSSHTVNMDFNAGVGVLIPAQEVAYYLIGNSVFTGVPESSSWSLSTGILMQPEGTNNAQIENHHFDEGAEVKIVRSVGGSGNIDGWVDVDLNGQSYDYCAVSGETSNLRFSKSGTYSIYLNQFNQYYIAGTPDAEPEQSSSASSSTPASKTYTGTWSEGWIAGDGCKVFVWAWGGNCGDGQWVSVALSGNGLSGSFTVTSEIDGFLFVRCVSTTTTPNWSTKGDSAGRIYNKTGDITASSGTYSYATSWQGYNP